jgi:acyl carrier protein
MTKEEVYKNVIEEIEDTSVVEGIEVTLDSKLEELEIDSLDAIDMIIFMEDKYKIKIDNYQLNLKEITTVREFADFVYSKMEK